MLGAGPRDADDVGLLEGVIANQAGGHLAAQKDDRGRVHVRVGQTGDGIGRPRPRGHDHHTGAARDAGIALGHMHGPLLVAHQDVLERRVVKRVISGQYRAPGITEDGIDTFGHEGLDDDPSTGERGGLREFWLLVCGRGRGLAACCHLSYPAGVAGLL